MSPLILTVVASLACVQDPPPAAAPASDPLAALTALPLQPPLEAGVRVVVKDADGKPVAGALVVHVTAAADAERRAEAERLHPGDEAKQYGFRVAVGEARQTDERGNIYVPVANGRVLACKDGRVATKPLRLREGKGPSRLELVLQPPRSFPVVVVDAQGAAMVDVPIGVMAAAGATMFPRRSSGPDGRAVFRVLGGRPPATALVGVDLAFTPPIAAPMPTAEGEEVRVQLPAYGSIRATFTGDLLPGSQPSWSLRNSARSFPPSETDGNTALFRWVGTDFQGELGVSVDGSYYSTPIDGVAAGARKEVGLEQPAEQRRVVLRVLDASGNVARSRSVRSSHRYRNSTSGSAHQTNAEGWLMVVLRGGEGQEGKLLLDLGGKSFDDPMVGSTELVIGKDAKGRIDLGEVRFTAATVALTGVAVDAAGKPIVDLSLSVRHDKQYHARTGADGRFQFSVSGDKPSSLEVQLQSEGWYFSEPTSRSRTFEAGTEARLVLQPAGRMRFSAAGLPKEMQTDFDVRLHPANDRGEVVELPNFPFGGDEVQLPPGHWHLVFHENGQERHRLDDVHVDPGIEVHDPRFMNFDWRAFAVLVTVRVEDKSGKPCDACTVWHHYGNVGSGRSPDGGRVGWLLPKDGGRISVEPDDQKLGTIELGVVTTDQIVRLGTGPALRIELSATPTLPSGVTLVAVVGAEHAGVAFDAEGKTMLWLPEPGEHQVQLAVRRDGTNHMLRMDPPRCDVPPGGYTLKISITEPLAKQIAELAGK